MFDKVIKLVDSACLLGLSMSVFLLVWCATIAAGPHIGIASGGQYVCGYFLACFAAAAARVAYRRLIAAERVCIAPAQRRLKKVA